MVLSELYLMGLYSMSNKLAILDNAKGIKYFNLPEGMIDVVRPTINLHLWRVHTTQFLVKLGMVYYLGY